MNQYVTGSIIRKLREEKKMTQLELAKHLQVSDKTVSKWETGKGYPDITLIEHISKALGISTIELLSGDDIRSAISPSAILQEDSTHIIKSIYIIILIFFIIIPPLREV